MDARHTIAERGESGDAFALREGGAAGIDDECALLLLGDILYYGPRNSLPPGMDRKRNRRLLWL